MKYKYVKSGDIIEIYEYEREVKREGNKSGRRGRNDTDTDTSENRKTVLSRAKKNLRRTINSNINAWGGIPKFLTLTFAENITDVRMANYEFNKFVKRLNYKINVRLKYSVVVEFQKRGAIHYHVILYNLPYTPSHVIKDCWGNGFIKINKIQHVDNVGAYVTKYMTKDNDDPRLRGEKSYFSSRGLHKPEEVKDLGQKEIQSLRQALDTFKTYNNQFENDYTGLITYEQYNLSRLPEAMEEE